MSISVSVAEVRSRLHASFERGLGVTPRGRPAAREVMTAAYRALYGGDPDHLVFVSSPLAGAFAAARVSDHFWMRPGYLVVCDPAEKVAPGHLSGTAPPPVLRWPDGWEAGDARR